MRKLALCFSAGSIIIIMLFIIWGGFDWVKTFGKLDSGYWCFFIVCFFIIAINLVNFIYWWERG